MEKSKFYNDYKNVRDWSWIILKKYNIDSLPVYVKRLCKQMGIHVLNYKKGKELVQDYKLDNFTKNEAFSTIIKGNYFVFYDDSVKPYGRLRFTVAHEIGHIVLGHVREGHIVCRGGGTVWNKGNDEPPNDYEAMANIFATRILAPSCVLWGLKIHSVDEIAQLCGLSKLAAKYKAERMEVLYEREKHWLEEKGKSCFLQSYKEIKVYKQFEGFIKDKDILTVQGFVGSSSVFDVTKCNIEKITKYEETEEYKQIQEQERKKQEQALLEAAQLGDRKQALKTVAEELKKTSEGIILDLELVDERIFSMTVSNQWHLSSREEQKYFAEEFNKEIQKVSNQWFGKSAVFSIYDENSQEVASSKISGGMKIND